MVGTQAAMGVGMRTKPGATARYQFILLWMAGLPLSDIQAALEISQSTASAWRVRLGLPPRLPGQPSKLVRYEAIAGLVPLYGARRVARWAGLNETAVRVIAEAA